MYDPESLVRKPRLRGGELNFKVGDMLKIRKNKQKTCNSLVNFT